MIDSTGVHRALRAPGILIRALVVASCLAALCAPLAAQTQTSGGTSQKATRAPAQPAKPAPRSPAPATATAPADSAASSIDWPSRDDVKRFVRMMSEKHGFDEIELLSIFSQARMSETVVRLMAPAPPGFRRSWTVYRSRFVEPFRIREGLRFWRDNAAAVSRASQRYGVPPEIIVSIIGVETIYGRQVGDFRVLDTLTTLAFEYPRRGEYFREELEQYLLLARESGFNPALWKGSFAGAVGLPQFMPASIRRHAVDFDGDGRIDLRNSPTDAIGSVARFLANHGWRSGAPTHFTAVLEDEARAQPGVAAGIPPALSRTDLAAMGVTSTQPLPADEPLSLIDLPNGDQTTSYVLGAHNFYVITRYNRSYFYAMAVIDLARELKADQPGKSPIDK